MLEEFRTEVVKADGSNIKVIRHFSQELLSAFFRSFEGQMGGVKVAVCSGFAYFPSFNLSVKCKEVNLYRLHCVVPHGVVALSDLLKHSSLPPKITECVLLQYELLTGEQANPDSVIPMAADLALHPFLLYRRYLSQVTRLKQEGLYPSYELLRDAQEAVVKCELAGIHFDGQAHLALIATWQAQADNSEAELKGELGAMNFNSTKQLSEAMGLYTAKKQIQGVLKDWPRGKSGQLTLDSATLKHYADTPGLSRLLGLILEYRSASKLLNTFGQSLGTWVVRSRIHTKLKLNGCVTGRLSSCEPNLQNVPHSSEFRKLFTAPQGRKLIVGDYSQIELRVAALLAHDVDMIRVFDRKQDLHLFTAASLLNIPEDQVTPDQRRLAKAVNFGMLYGQGAPGLAGYAESKYGVTLTFGEAKAYIIKFYTTFPGVKAWQDSLKTAKFVSTPLGRKRRTSVPMEKQNTPIQGGAAEVMLKLLVKLASFLRNSGCELVNLVHDEVIIEAAEAQAEACCGELRRLMQEAWTDFLTEAHLDSVTWDVAKVSTGSDWDSAKQD
jgi:DNA polymerase-1